MKFSTALLPLAALVSGAAAEADRAKMDAVEEVFRRTWNGYREHAWGHDSLRPVSNGYTNDRYGQPRGSRLSLRSRRDPPTHAADHLAGMDGELLQWMPLARLSSWD